jgi:hypothetical protein
MVDDMRVSSGARFRDLKGHVQKMTYEELMLSVVKQNKLTRNLVTCYGACVRVPPVHARPHRAKTLNSEKRRPLPDNSLRRL